MNVIALVGSWPYMSVPSSPRGTVPGQTGVLEKERSLSTSLQPAKPVIKFLSLSLSLVLGDHAPPSFMCSGQLVEQVPSLKYLCLHFHESGLVSEAKMAASCQWAVVQKKHALRKRGDTVNLKLKLLQTILVPTIHYGCEVWGMHSQRTYSANSARSQLQHLYEQYLRRICRLSPSVPAAMLLCELNLLPLKVFWWRQCLCFWDKLVAVPLDSFHRTVLLDNLQDAVRFRVRNFSSSGCCTPECGAFNAFWVGCATYT